MLTIEEMRDILTAIDPETKRLPPGFRAFGQAIEAAVLAKQAALAQKSIKDMTQADFDEAHGGEAQQEPVHKYRPRDIQDAKAWLKDYAASYAPGSGHARVALSVLEAQQEPFAYLYEAEGFSDAWSKRKLAVTFGNPKVTPLYTAIGVEMDAEHWAELHTLRVAVKGPDGFATWQDAAVHERIKRVKAQEAMRLALEAIVDDRTEDAIAAIREQLGETK